MTDRYIDLDEKGIYGSVFARRGETYAGTIPEDGDANKTMRAMILLAVAEVRATTSAIAAALEPSRRAKAEIHDRKIEKEPVLTEAKRKLGALAAHLTEQEKRDVVLDRHRFFDGGKVSSIGTGSAAVLGAVGRAIAGCRAYEAKIPSLVERRAELEELLPRLTDVIEDSATARGDHRAATPEVRAASVAWNTAYGAAKDIMRGILTLRGEISRMPWLFHDLAVPAGTQMRTEPSDMPTPPSG